MVSVDLFGAGGLEVVVTCLDCGASGKDVFPSGQALPGLHCPDCRRARREREAAAVVALAGWP